MGRIRQLLVWTVRSAVFILLFGLALKNGDLVDLYFFFGQHWEMPVSLLVLLSVTLGAVLGLTAAFSRRTNASAHATVQTTSKIANDNGI